MLVKPVAKENLSSQLYNQLRTALMDGQLAPGERLTISGIAEQFGTSITPVREAIFRLVSERALGMMNAMMARTVTAGTAGKAEFGWPAIAQHAPDQRQQD